MSYKQEKIWTRSSTTPLQIRRCPDTNTTKRKREKQKKKCAVAQGSLHEIKNKKENKNNETYF
jgi:ribosome assembly protein YihI (activator of Der GTPase)